MTMSIYDLERRIGERALERPEGSYTVRLLDEGVEKCAKKLGEEAVELGLAAMSGFRPNIVGEGADLLYHTLVLLRSQGISLAEVEAELAVRDEQRSENPKANHRGT